MKEIELNTKSFFFEDANEKVRAIPFYELSIMEWVIYENNIPKYYISFDRRKDPLILYLTAEMNGGKEIEKSIKDLGLSINRSWTTSHNIKGKEVEGSHQSETIKLLLLTDINEVVD